MGLVWIPTAAFTAWIADQVTTLSCTLLCAGTQHKIIQTCRSLRKQSGFVFRVSLRHGALHAQLRFPRTTLLNCPRPLTHPHAAPLLMVSLT